MPDKPISITTKEPEIDQLGEKLLTQIRAARSGMSKMLADQKTWDMFYESNLPSKDFPWKGCANINIPLTQSHVDTWVSHVNDVILGVDPIVLVQPPMKWGKYQGSKEAAQKVEKLLAHYETEVMELESVISDDVTPTAMRTPVAVVKLFWDEQYRTVQRYNEAGQIEAQKEVKYRGPRPELVELGNFVMFPLTAKNPEAATLIGDRYRLTEDQVRRKIADGLFDKKRSEKLLESLASESDANIDDNTEDVLDVEGTEKLAEFEALWFWEVIAGYDVDGDGLNEDCLITLEAETGTIVRAIPYPYFHGRRCYIMIPPFKRPNRAFGRCIPQILEGCQRGINTVHNQRTDATSVVINPVFKRRKGAEADAIEFFPGATIDVDSMDDLQEMQMNPMIPGSDIETQLLGHAERASSINDMSLGRASENSNTAKEVAIVNAEGGIRFSDVIRRVQVANVEIARQVLGLLYQFASDDELMEFELTREELGLNWKLIPHGNTGTANKAQKRQEALLMYKLLMGGDGVQPNPLIGQKLSRIYRVSQDILLAFDREGVEEYIGTEEEVQQLEDAMLAQQEAAALAQREAMANELGGEASGMEQARGPMGAGGDSPAGVGGGLQGPPV